MADQTKLHTALINEVLVKCSGRPNRDGVTAILLRNDVGQGFYQRALPLAVKSLHAAGYNHAASIVTATFNRCRVSYGLAVGSPDIVVVTPGFLGLEGKTGDADLKPEQRAFRAAAEKAGARIETIRSVEDAERALGFR